MYQKRPIGQVDHPLPRKILEDRDFQNLLGCLNVGLFVCDSLFHRIISFTPHLTDLLKVDPVDLKMNPSLWGEMLRSLEGGRIDEVMVNALDRGEDADFDLKILDFHGQTRRVRLSLLNCSSHRYHEIVGQIQDITHLRRQEIAVARVESLEAEYSARIQKRLLLGNPRNLPKGLLIHAKSIPSQHVDGDFYDFNHLSRETQDFYMGDVMGKGLNAALLGAGVKNLFNKALITLLTAGNSIPDPRQIIDLVDSHVTKELMRFNSFITLTYGRINLLQGIISFVDCGNTPMIHFSSRENSCWLVSGGNMPLGFVDHQSFLRHDIPLCTGDLFFLYSDGLTETENAENEALGVERLIRMILGYRELSPEKLTKKIIDLCFHYSGGGFRDDATAMVMKIENTPPQVLWSHFYTVSIGSEDYANIIDQCMETWKEEAQSHLSREGILFLLPQIAQWLKSLNPVKQKAVESNKRYVLEELDLLEESTSSMIQGLCWCWNDQGLFIELTYQGDALEKSFQQNHPFNSLTLMEGLHHFHKIVGYLEIEER